MENTQTREQILAAALESREQEVLHYQINIDNYTIALADISALSVEERAEISVFADQLRTLLATEKLEQKKAKIMLEVIRKQLDV